MDVAKATISFNAKPQVQLGGQVKEFTEIEVGGKKFQGVDLGNGNYARLKDRQNGKYDVVLFRGDSADISKMSVMVSGGSVSRLRTTDNQKFDRDNGSLLQGKTLSFDNEFATEFTQGLSPTVGKQGLPQDSVELPPPPDTPPPPLPDNVKVPSSKVEQGSQVSGSGQVPKSSLSPQQQKVADEFFNVGGVRTNSKTDKLQHTFGDLYSSYNEHLLAHSQNTKLGVPNGGDRLIDSTGNKPEERLMGAFVKALPVMNLPMMSHATKTGAIIERFRTQLPEDQRPPDVSTLASMPNNGGLRTLYLPMREMMDMAKEGNQAKFGKAAAEFLAKASSESQKFFLAGQMLTDPDLLSSLPKADREQVRALGEAYQGIAKEMLAPDGALQRARRFAAEVVKSPGAMMEAVRQEATAQTDAPRVPTQEQVPQTPPETPAPPKIDLDKIKNPAVRKQAEKLAGRAGKFQDGVDLAINRGIKHLSSMKVEGELQKLFELADANNDPQILEDFAAATSFSGKLMPFQPTSEQGRSNVRLAQLYSAVQGDGSYATIKGNISKLANSAATLRQMARDDNLLASLDQSQYVDSSRLLRTLGGVPGKPVSDIHREWYLDQATLMKAYNSLPGKDTPMHKKLALAMLQSYAKAAPVGAERSEQLASQSSPILNTAAFYHRSASTNPLLLAVRMDIAKEIGINEGTFHMVDNATFREVLARDYAMPGVKTNIGSPQDFQDSIQALFQKAANNEFPTDKVVLDVTDLYKDLNLSPAALKDKCGELEGLFLAEAEKFLQNNPGVDKKKFGDLLMKNLQVASMSQHKGVDLLITPSFLTRGPKEGDTPLQKELLKSAASQEETYYDGAIGDVAPHTVFLNKIESTLMHTGYRLDPIQARKAWLEVSSPEQVLGKYGIQLTELATSDKPTPTVFTSFKDFTQHATFQKFEALSSSPTAPPYLKVLPKATANLLHGLAAYKPDQGGVDKAMKDAGLNEVLQTAYFRMMNAMAEAVHNQGDMVAFNNSIELLQQEVSVLVGLVEPHGDNAFGEAILGRMTDKNGPGGKPVIPDGLDKPGVQLKPSAMHCLASILSSVESLKGGKDLNVCVVKDHYYESSGAVESSRTYSVSSLEGDDLRGPDGTGTQPLDPNSLKGNKPLDLYVCDFHHNISLERNHYQTENLMHHVDEMFDKGLVADKFTVAIDCTIDFINSEDIQKFLEHNKDRIKDGSLNVVLFRSAQKFDMFGMDNFYGGFSININNHSDYQAFNQRMEKPEDQLKGLSRQGLTNNAVNGGPQMDEYRKALMDNTKRFYDALPEGMIWSEGNKSAMYIAKTEDPNAAFLDIRFPDMPETNKAFITRFKKFAEDEGLPLTSRASFGFATSNLNLIHGSKTRLNPGLEGPEVQDRYIQFFKDTHSMVNIMKDAGTKLGLSGDGLDKYMAQMMQSMPVPYVPDTSLN